MYWFKLRPYLVIAIVTTLAALYSGCKPEAKQSGGKAGYFDIKGFFTNEAQDLQKVKPPVLKTIVHNGVTETKKVSIENWGQELESFVGGDINRPAWKNSYTTSTGDGITLYKAIEPELTVREIIIKKDADKIKWIIIYTKTQNILYRNIEKLSYYPDSLYRIEKRQHVRLMGNNNYNITGVIIK
ncbi:MAG: hypothetical protein ACTHMI_11150 [Mucilaginibacter sp.]